MVELKILNPQATTAINPVGLASRLSDLSRRTIGLYWNMKAGGDVALEHTARLLGERFPKAEFRYYAVPLGPSCGTRPPRTPRGWPGSATRWWAQREIEARARRGLSTIWWNSKRRGSPQFLGSHKGF